MCTFSLSAGIRNDSLTQPATHPYCQLARWGWLGVALCSVAALLSEHYSPQPQPEKQLHTKPPKSRVVFGKQRSIFLCTVTVTEKTEHCEARAVVRTGSNRPMVLKAFAPIATAVFCAPTLDPFQPMPSKLIPALGTSAFTGPCQVPSDPGITHPLAGRIARMCSVMPISSICSCDPA